MKRPPLAEKAARSRSMDIKHEHAGSHRISITKPHLVNARLATLLGESRIMSILLGRVKTRGRPGEQTVSPRPRSTHNIGVSYGKQTLSREAP